MSSGIVKTVTTPYGTFSYWPQDCIGNCIAQGEFWDVFLRPAFDAVPEGSIVVDAGANIGWFTIYAAKRGCYVYAFEACQDVFGLLRLNVEQNGVQDRVSMFPVALYDRCEQLTVNKLAADNPANEVFVEGRIDRSVCCNSGSLELRPGQGGPYDQYAVPLDFFNLSGVALIKVDTEGCDLRILKGAEKTIRRSWPILCYEYLVDAQKVHGDRPEDFDSFVRGLGYAPEEVDSGQRYQAEAGADMDYRLFVARHEVIL